MGGEKCQRQKKNKKYLAFQSLKERIKSLCLYLLKNYSLYSLLASRLLFKVKNATIVHIAIIATKIEKASIKSLLV